MIKILYFLKTLNYLIQLIYKILLCINYLRLKNIEYLSFILFELAGICCWVVNGGKESKYEIFFNSCTEIL